MRADVVFLFALDQFAQMYLYYIHTHIVLRYAGHRSKEGLNLLEVNSPPPLPLPPERMINIRPKYHGTCTAIILICLFLTGLISFPCAHNVDFRQAAFFQQVFLIENQVFLIKNHFCTSQNDTSSTIAVLQIVQVKMTDNRRWQFFRSCTKLA